jgi:hypothetical protein
MRGFVGELVWYCIAVAVRPRKKIVMTSDFGIHLSSSGSGTNPTKYHWRMAMNALSISGN